MWPLPLQQEETTG